MGGDEFCALFEPRLEDRVTLLDGAALALSEHGDGFWIGCSYGSIALPSEATDADEALRIADQRMYAQKNAGRTSASRQVKEVLLGVLGARDPELAATSRAVADLAEATARQLGLGREERETAAPRRRAARRRQADAPRRVRGRRSREIAARPASASSPPPRRSPTPRASSATLHEHWDGSRLPGRPRRRRRSRSAPASSPSPTPTTR